MPTYEYECTKCGKTLEAEQKITEPPLKDCPQTACDGSLKRLIAGQTSFVLNGRGWFKDGY